MEYSFLSDSLRSIFMLITPIPGMWVGLDWIKPDHL